MRFSLLQHQRDAQNAVIWIVLKERFFQSGVWFLTEYNPNRTKSRSQRCSVWRKNISSQLVDRPQKRSRLKMNGFISLFKIVQLFQNGDWDRNIVFFESPDALCVVQNDIGIDDKQFVRTGGLCR
jgi:hypothetical protein